VRERELDVVLEDMEEIIGSWKGVELDMKSSGVQFRGDEKKS
jgi:hypothetical protein